MTREQKIDVLKRHISILSGKKVEEIYLYGFTETLTGVEVEYAFNPDLTHSKEHNEAMFHLVSWWALMFIGI